MKKHSTNLRDAPNANVALRLAYLHGSVVHYRPGEVLSERTLTDFELVHILEGQVVYRLEGRDHEAPPGSVILARPGFREQYRWDPHGLTRHAYFHFNLERRPADWPAWEDWPVVRTHPDPVVSSLFRHVLARIASHPDWPAASPTRQDSRMVEALLGAFLDPVTYGEGPVTARLPKPVQDVLTYMRQLLENEAHRPVTLDDLARVSGVSGKHLCRLFQSSLHHPPLATLRLLKLQFGLVLLARSHLAIKEIADRCGFDNPLYFSRCFAQVYRMSPTEARQRMEARKAPPVGPLPADLMPRLFW